MFGRRTVVSSIRISRSDDSYGRGRIRTASTTLKTAVFAPIPSARMAVTAAAKRGLWRSHRKAQTRSCVILTN
jgi:hypothetical protein